MQFYDRGLIRTFNAMVPRSNRGRPTIFTQVINNLFVICLRHSLLVKVNAGLFFHYFFNRVYQFFQFRWRVMRSHIS